MIILCNVVCINLRVLSLLIIYTYITLQIFLL